METLLRLSTVIEQHIASCWRDMKRELRCQMDIKIVNTSVEPAVPSLMQTQLRFFLIFQGPSVYRDQGLFHSSRLFPQPALETLRKHLKARAYSICGAQGCLELAVSRLRRSNSRSRLAQKHPMFGSQMWWCLRLWRICFLSRRAYSEDELIDSCETAYILVDLIERY